MEGQDPGSLRDHAAEGIRNPEIASLKKKSIKPI
jgi:hypothetical protein